MWHSFCSPAQSDWGFALESSHCVLAVSGMRRTTAWLPAHFSIPRQGFQRQVTHMRLKSRKLSSFSYVGAVIDSKEYTLLFGKLLTLNKVSCVSFVHVSVFPHARERCVELRRKTSINLSKGSPVL